MGRPALDIVGKRFGKLIILGRWGTRGHQLLWRAKCDCGNVVLVNSANVLRRKTKGCGCLRHQAGKNNPAYRHGQTLTPEYRAYQSAKTRCTNTKVICFPEYGGRGIEFRFISFDQWYRELGPRPSTSHSVDRPDNDGHYEPGNVKWATKIEQVVNRRRANPLKKFTDTQLYAEIARREKEFGMGAC